MATKKEVAVKSGGDVVPAYIRQGKGRGSENVSSQDIQIPRIDIIQDLSPQHKENKPEYIPGAKVGMLFNTLTKDLYPNGVDVVPVWYDKQFLVWKSQKKGGGLNGVFGKDQKAEAENRAATLGEDYECVETPTQICILIDEDGEPICEVSIPLSKSKMKVNRTWNSLIRLQGGDRFSRKYRLASIEDANNEGQEFLNYSVQLNGFPSESAYHEAERLYEAIVGGQTTVSTNYSDATPPSSNPDGEDY
jgi:hypothetical protein